MSSIKCPSCGLVNFADAVSCKRCEKSLVGDSAPAQSSKAEARPVQYVITTPSPSKGSGLRRDGELLVLTEDVVFPERCVKCNGPAGKQIKRTVEFTPGHLGALGIFTWLFGLPLISWVALLIAYAYKRETATIHFGICDRHYNMRLIGLIVGGGLIGLGLLMGVISVFNKDYWLLAYGGLSLLIGAFPAVILTPTVEAQRIEQPFIWLKGAHRDFLDSLSS